MLQYFLSPITYMTSPSNICGQFFSTCSSFQGIDDLDLLLQQGIRLSPPFFVKSPHCETDRSCRCFWQTLRQQILPTLLRLFQFFSIVGLHINQLRSFFSCGFLNDQEIFVPNFSSLFPFLRLQRFDKESRSK